MALIGAASIVALVVITRWLDHEVLRSGNRWLTWASCALIAWSAVLVIQAASMSRLSGPDHEAEDWACVVVAGQFFVAIPLLIGTLASTVVEWAASSHPQRWRILVVPFVACAIMVTATVTGGRIWTVVLWRT